MVTTIAIAQCGYPTDGDVTAQVERWLAVAAGAGASLVVFPEDLMSPSRLTPSELRDLAEPLEGPFVKSIRRACRGYGVWSVVTFYECNPVGGAPYNTAVLIDASGEVRGTYRKCHLYDAHGVLESERNTPGDTLFTPVEAPFGKLGLGICYDLRFPEVVRAAAIAGCQLFVFPSAWHDGPHKVSHWETLLRARAIENELFVVGACRAGERYTGRSLVANPLGNVLVRANGKDEELLVCDIDQDAVLGAREAMPVLDHRHPELYHALSGIE